MAHDGQQILSKSANDLVGVCLSERDIAILLASLSGIEFRSAFDPLTDSEWDNLEASIAETAFSISGIDPCGGTTMRQGARTKLDGNQPVAAGVNTTLILQDPTVAINGFDTDGYWDSSQPDRFTAPTDGLYQVTGNLTFSNSATASRRSAWIVTDAGEIIAGESYPSAGFANVSFGGEIPLNSGDSIFFRASSDVNETIRAISVGVSMRRVSD